MAENGIMAEQIIGFANHLRQVERSPGSIENYLRHVRSFAAWLEDGATGLYEKWTDGGTMSKNHHMYSNFCAWFFNSLAGIVPAAGEVHIRPAFVRGLQFVEAQCRGVRVRWERAGEGIVLEIEAPADANVFYGKEKIVGNKRVVLPR